MKILSIAPTRISLFGGGTDVDPYASTYGGICINMAINLRQKVTMFSGDDMYELSGKSQFPWNANPDFYYKILQEYGINDGVHLTKLVSEFDGLIESGIGSSASAAVALLGAINKRLKLGLTPAEIAEKAWDVEVNKLGLYGGRQDQYAAAFGGVNCMEFKKGGGVNVVPLAKGFIEPLLPNLILFYTGQNRKSATIQEGFKDLNTGQIKALDQIKTLALHAIDPIAKGDTKQVAELMQQAWELKKLSNKGVTNSRIDEIYQAGLKAGALSGKIMGAGGGGYMLFICEVSKQPKLIEAMKKLNVEYWDFSVCWNGLETRDITDK